MIFAQGTKPALLQKGEMATVASTAIQNVNPTISHSAAPMSERYWRMMNPYFLKIARAGSDLR